MVFRLGLLIGVIAFASFARACPGGPPAGTQCVPAWSSKNIVAHSVCRSVTNNHGSGLPIFVPINTGTEWASFYNSPPAGVSAGACPPAAATYTSSGNFAVPAYSTMTVQVWGGGGSGGGGGACGNPGHGYPGGQSRFDAPAPVVADGGGGGSGCDNNPGGGGGASGGDVNLAGAGGSGGGNREGGGSPNGGAGGATFGAHGGIPGGGGAGGDDSNSNNRGAGGGGGGYASKTFTVGAPGAPVPGANIWVTVAPGGGDSPENGGFGARGEVRINWNY